MTDRRLRIALHTETDGWVELTAPGAAPQEVNRLRVGTLSEAARLAQVSDRPAFVDIDVVLADSVNRAFLEFTEQHPDWFPGARTEAIAHPGTSATLAGLLWDIWAARVADGVTLHSSDPHGLLDRVIDEVIPLLEARGLPLPLEVVVAA